MGSGNQQARFFGCLPAAPLRARIKKLLPDRWRQQGGSIALLRLCFGETVPTDQLALLRQSFIEIYRQRLADRSRLFPGFTQILTALEARQLPWGVVTNKPVSLAASLLRHLGLESRSCCLIGGDSLPVSKPDPAPLLQAALLCETQPQECAYIGDARADILAARGAGMQALIAGWGYLDPADNPSTWGADRILGSPIDLLSLIDPAPALNGL